MNPVPTSLCPRRIPIVYQLSVSQPENPVEAADDLFIVGDGDDRRVLLDRELAKKVHHDSGPFGVECRSRLVGENNPRPIGQCPSDRHTLRLAAGEVGWHGVFAMADLQVLKQIDRAPLCLALRTARQVKDQRDIVGAVKERQQVVELEDEANLLQSQPA